MAVAKRVIVDTLACEIYNIRELPKQKEPVQSQQKFEKQMRTTTHFIYWTVLLGVSIALNGILKPIIENPLIRSTMVGLTTGMHQIAISKLVKRFRTGQTEKQTRPGLAAYSATLALVEPWPITAVSGAVLFVGLGVSGTVSAPMAVLFSVVATATALTLEYLAFRLIWPKTFLKTIELGTIRDDLTGFMKVFDVRRFYSDKKHPEPPKTSAEYIGQIWGIIQSYWFPVQVLRTVAVAIFAELTKLRVDDFIVAAPNFLNGINSIFFVILGTKCRMELSDMFAKSDTGPNQKSSQEEAKLH